MSERTVVEQSPRPFTRSDLVHDLTHLGVTAGMVLLVHSSLSKIGYVPGGPVAVIQALMDVLTPAGTLVMPTHTSDYSEPATWQNPPVPADWQPIVRAHTPAFEPALTPTRQMGAIPELFRTWPDVLRSNHPQVSFAAWGQRAAQITANHSLTMGMGNESPLARIYDLDGYVLLLGVGHANNSSFHLGEYRAGVRPVIMEGAPILENGRRLWREYEELDYDNDPFPQIGTALEETGAVTIGQVGLAECRLFMQRTAVDFAQEWLTATIK
jgi:aminoglycoside 3-N-acetyltransferase